MTFKRSLYISICIHVLVFGSAIAFAQFARGALWGNRDAVMVLLVGSGPGPTGRSLQRAGHRERQSNDRPVVTNKTTSLAMQPEMPAHKPSAQEETSIWANKESRRSDPGDAGAPQGQGGAVITGSGPDTQFGLISAEQWAVIESAIERSKNYPRVARERGIQGVVHVRFKLRPSGDVEAVEIVKSSGYDVLDTASIRTVYRAAPMPYVSGWVEVPMAYVLK
jgi:TonB family protein